MLNVDDGVCERDQHAGVRVAEVVQCGVRRWQVGGFAGAFECVADDFALEPVAVVAARRGREALVLARVRGRSFGERHRF